MTHLASLVAGYRAVVVGATGGIGQAVRRHLEADPRAGEVIALSRASQPRLDLTDEASIGRAAERIGEYGPVHYLFDASGILHGPGINPEKNLAALDPAVIARVFEINATGPALLLKHFHRLFPREEKAVFATLSARVGSIADNRLGGWYAYRASKAALNMFMVTGAIEVARVRPRALVVSLHPGTVATGLSQPFRGDRETFTPEEAAGKLIAVTDSLDAEATGGFFDYAGRPIAF